MAMDDDALLKERVRPKSTLLDIRPAARPAAVDTVEAPESESSAFDDFATLPQPGSPYETAHSRASNKPVPTLRFVMGDSIRGFPYCNYDSIDWLVPEGKPGASPAIVIRFTGLVAREAIIVGRNLLKLYDLLSFHRVAWVRELPKGKDFMAKGQTVITGITIRQIKEAPA